MVTPSLVIPLRSAYKVRSFGNNEMSMVDRSLSDMRSVRKDIRGVERWNSFKRFASRWSILEVPSISPDLPRLISLSLLNRSKPSILAMRLFDRSSVSKLCLKTQRSSNSSADDSTHQDESLKSILAILLSLALSLTSLSRPNIPERSLTRLLSRFNSVNCFKQDNSAQSAP